ncbi:MAG: flavodoxin domain-containing protein [Methanoregula sp.]|nr:flavodoxin domain-containing protein [Methanoregula sp.]
MLVAYASRKGSTAGIAQAVGRELEKAGITVEVAEMRTVTSLESYDAVVIGAPVYMGRLVDDITDFAKRYKSELQKKPVAAFAAGIAPVAPKVESVDTVMENLRKVLDPIQTIAVTMFAGTLDPAQQSFIERTMTKLLNVPTGDFRDWTAITAWARELSSVLKV